MNIRNTITQDIGSLMIIKPTLKQKGIRNRFLQQRKGIVEFLILEDKNEPVGFVYLKWEGKKTHPEYPDLEDLYVRFGFRNKGYGTALIKECEKRAKQKSFTKIGLAVNPNENSKARKLYQKLGYSHDGGRSYVDGVYDGVKDWVIDFEKDI